MAAAAHQSALKPRLRGVLHQWAFVISVAAGVGLVYEAGSARARLATSIYALSVVCLFGTSAVYHRTDWTTLRARRCMRRLDHMMIFVLIAGSYTPFALLVLHGAMGVAMVIVVWSVALAGALFKVVWIDAPPRLIAAVYVAIGWIALAVVPQLVSRLGLPAVAAMVLGGALYTAGAVIHARKRPDPLPAVFGYHELFHALVIAAAAVQYAVVAFWVV